MMMVVHAATTTTILVIVGATVTMPTAIRKPTQPRESILEKYFHNLIAKFNKTSKQWSLMDTHPMVRLLLPK